MFLSIYQLLKVVNFRTFSEICFGISEKCSIFAPYLKPHCKFNSNNDMCKRNVQEIEKELAEAKRARNEAIRQEYVRMTRDFPERPKYHIYSEIAVANGLTAQAVDKIVRTGPQPVQSSRKKGNCKNVYEREGRL